MWEILGKQESNPGLFWPGRFLNGDGVTVTKAERVGENGEAEAHYKNQ